MSLFVRVVTHYGSNESNDSLGVFSDMTLPGTQTIIDKKDLNSTIFREQNVQFCFTQIWDSWDSWPLTSSHLCSPIEMHVNLPILKVHLTLKVFWSSENRSFVFNQIFVYGTLMGVDYKSEKKI